MKLNVFTCKKYEKLIDIAGIEQKFYTDFSYIKNIRKNIVNIKLD